MSEPTVTELLTGIQRNLVEVDHYYCELISLGLQLNRQSINIPHDLALIHEMAQFKKQFAEFIKGVSQAALVSDKAFILTQKIKIETKHQEDRKSCNG